MGTGRPGGATRPAIAVADVAADVLRVGDCRVTPVFAEAVPTFGATAPVDEPPPTARNAYPTATRITAAAAHRRTTLARFDLRRP